MTPRLLAIVEAARAPHTRAKLTGTEIAELADAVVAAERVPTLASCGDCAHLVDNKRGGHCSLGDQELPAEDVIPDWCGLRSKGK